MDDASEFNLHELGSVESFDHLHFISVEYCIFDIILCDMGHHPNQICSNRFTSNHNCKKEKKIFFFFPN